MKCRAGCGACCIAPSISSAIPGMPNGKPAGVRCVNLGDDFRCRIWQKQGYPPVCRSFQAETLMCGSSRGEALTTLAVWETLTAPDGASANV